MKRIIYALLLGSFLILQINTAFAQADAGEQRLATNQKETSISLFPMPANGTLHIAFNKAIVESPSVVIYDMIGNRIENISLEREATGSFTINLTGKRPGFYFIKVQTGEETFSRRITVTP
ncbi:MAG: T9SS type A sorting domain-containing protein [Bacteroidetes bacterium]|jgi:hypothetical protein|nr:T9SS type A sorting domain-containing protein [Bacteroidota bacterium]MBK9320366.1 T9SS type A sorting domain-containing protein [Bacteroidota bacterium]